MEKIIKDISEMLRDNKTTINRINKEDNQINKFDFDLNKLIKIIEKYKNFNISDKINNENIMICHYGNPYITAILCLESLIYGHKIMININDFCYGINKAIIKIMNDVLRDYKIKRTINLENNISKNQIQERNIKNIICLGNSNVYSILRKMNGVEVKYIPLFDIVLHYDSVEFEELSETIREYATQNLYEIEIFDETEEFEDVISMIDEKIYCAILLSKNKEKQEIFKREIKTEKVIINENPFDKFELEIPKEVWN